MNHDQNHIHTPFLKNQKNQKNQKNHHVRIFLSDLHLDQSNLRCL